MFRRVVVSTLLGGAWGSVLLDPSPLRLAISSALTIYWILLWIDRNGGSK